MEYRSVMRLTPGDEKRLFLESKGIFFLDDEIDDSSAYITCLNIFNFHLKKIVDGVISNDPIWIILNSPGGLVSYGLTIYDGIRAVVERGRVINILGIGHVASMAAVILQAGSKRYSFPHTKFLLHEISSDDVFEDASKGEEKLQEIQRMNDLVMSIVANRCGIDKDELKKICKKTDYCLDPEKAKQFGAKGLIDEVITALPF